MPSLWTRALVVDEPTWPLRIPEPPPPARGEPEPAGRFLFRIAEAAELLAISRSSLYQLISAGEVQTMRLGRLGAIDPAVAKLNMDRPPNPTPES